MSQCTIPNWHDPLVIQDPYPAYAVLRRESPVAWDQGRGIWIVSSHQDCQKILKDPRFLSNRSSQFLQQYAAEEQAELKELFEGLNYLAIYQDGAVHAAIRGPLVRAFAMRTQASFCGAIEDELGSIFDGLKGQKEVDLFQSLALRLPLAVISRVLQIPLDKSRELHGWSSDIARFLDQSTNINLARKALTALRNFQSYLRPLIHQREQSGAQDLLSLLAGLQASDAGVSKDDIVGNLILVFMAGHETTMALIANGIHLIWSRPDLLDTLRQERSLIPRAVEEVMRFDSPAQRIGRRIGEDLLWNGSHAFKKGQFVQVLLGAANRDENEFERADEFHIHREKNQHLGFGSGAHYCVGAQLARLEASLAFSRLMDWFPNMALVDQGAPYFSNLSLRCRTSVRVKLY